MRQLPRPKGRVLFVRPMGLTEFRASVPGQGVSGSLTTDTPPRKATAAFLMFIAALWSRSNTRPQWGQSWTRSDNDFGITESQPEHF